MASERPDLASMKSWEEAFDYPLQTTRAVERALRTEVASNRDRLRTLVGCYTPFLMLATADANLKPSEQAIVTY